MSRHVLFSISPHGFGHASMTAPVVNALRRRLPGLRVTLRTTLPREWIEERYEGRPELLRGSEVVPVMTDAVRVDRQATAAAFAAEHAAYDRLVAEEAARLDRLGVDAVVANVSHLILDAARMAGRPAVAMSCLNWADVYEHCCGWDDVAARMRRSYMAADLFLRATPAMPMPWLDNCRDIGPVATPGRRRPADLAAALNLPPGVRVGLVAFGGFDIPLRFADWPQHKGWHWMVPPRFDPGRDDMSPWPAAGMSFPDLMASVDLIIAKPGYATFVEAAALAVPILYLPRPDWPETEHMVRWLHEHARCAPVANEDLAAGRLAPLLDSLMAGLSPSPVGTDGAEEAADILAELIGRNRR